MSPDTRCPNARERPRQFSNARAPASASRGTTTNRRRRAPQGRRGAGRADARARVRLNPTRRGERRPRGGELRGGPGLSSSRAGAVSSITTFQVPVVVCLRGPEKAWGRREEGRRSGQRPREKRDSRRTSRRPYGGLRGRHSQCARFKIPSTARLVARCGMLEPYSDKPTAPGDKTTPDVIAAARSSRRSRGIQMCVHAIGESRQSRTLKIFGRRSRRTGKADLLGGAWSNAAATLHLRHSRFGSLA